MRPCPLVSFRLFIALFVLWAMPSHLARAGFIVSGADQDIVAGSTGTIVFSISGGATDQLAAFQLQLQVLGSAGNSGLLQFSPVADQPNAYNSAGYVFFNNSLDQSPPAGPFWDSVANSANLPGGPDDLITGGDSTITGATTFAGDASYVLATVQVDATNAVVGDTYQIVLVPGPASNPASYFQDSNNNDLDYGSSPVDITIVSSPGDGGPPSAVPEPSTLLAAGIGGLTCLLHRCWRSRKRAGGRCRAGA